jgi:hypothetical protein
MTSRLGLFKINFKRIPALDLGSAWKAICGDHKTKWESPKRLFLFLDKAYRRISKFTLTSRKGFAYFNTKHLPQAHSLST